MINKISLFILGLFLSSVAIAAPIKIYVSMHGDDRNSGSRRNPLQSVDAAIEKASQYKNINNVTIYLEKGVFEIQKPIEISYENWNGKYRLALRGEGQGKTVISGGIELPSFISDAESGLWFVLLEGKYKVIDGINQLFVNGKRSILARTPNMDRYYVPVEARETCIDERKNLYNQTVVLKAEDARTLSTQLKDATVTVFHYWDMSRRKVKGINSKERNFSMVGASVKRWGYFKEKGSTQLYLENDKSFLDCPGEFYFDRVTKVLYYYPREGETIQNVKAIVPLADSFIHVKGNAEHVVSNIEISDLTFSYSKYVMPEGGEEPEQAVASKEADIMLDYTSNIEFNNVEVCHTGMSAIWFRTACKDTKVEHCYFHDLGAGGIKVGVKETVTLNDPLLTKNVSVNNCIIREGGRTLPPAVGIQILKAKDCRITHNEIADFYYSGISIGWIWGFGESPTRNNYVGYNHIHHIGWGALSDMGGIYTLGNSTGTIIDNNIIHHVLSYGADGVGLYLDEGSSNIIVKNNFVYECKSAGFSQHFGRDNLITNNIFANNYITQLGVAEVNQEKMSLKFRNNIVYASRGGNIFKNFFWGGYKEIIADSNLYWVSENNKPLYRKTLSEWTEATGKDFHSVVEDPLITFFSDGKVRIVNKRALRKIGYRPIDSSKVGVYGSMEWKEQAKMESERENIFKELVESNMRPYVKIGTLSGNAVYVAALAITLLLFGVGSHLCRKTDNNS